MQYLIFLLLLLFSLPVYTQSPPPQDYEWRVKRKETIRTFYKTERNIILSNLDKAKLKRTESVHLVDKYYVSSDKMPITYIEKLETEGVYKDYMIKPALFEINTNGTFAYDEYGNTLKHIPHSTKYLDLVRFKGNGVFQTFHQISSDDLRNFEHGDFSVSQDGVVTAIAGKVRLIYDPNSLAKTVITTNTNDEITSSIITQYIKISSLFPSYINSDDVVPIFSKETVKEDLPSGACADLVISKSYEDYEIYQGNSGVQLRQSNENSLITVILYPNPVSNQLFISINNKNSNYDLQIFDELGNPVFQRSGLKGIMELDVTNWLPGIYFTHIGQNNSQHSSKFIKL